MFSNLKNPPEFLMGLLSNTQEGVLFADARGNVLVLNRVARALLGLSSQQEHPISWEVHVQLFHADGLRLLKGSETPLTRILKGKMVQDQAMVIETQDGQRRQVSCSARQVHDGQGKLLGAVMNLKDLTPENTLQQALLALQQSETQEHDLKSTCERLLGENKVLRGITQRLFTVLKSEDIARVILEETLPVFPLKNVSIFLKNVDHTQLLVTSSVGVNARIVEELAHSSLDTLLPHSEVARFGQAQFYPMVKSLQEKHPELSWLGEHLSEASLAFLPIKVGSETMGTLFLQMEARTLFREDEQDFMETLADQVALAIARFRLHHLEQQNLKNGEETIARLQAILDHVPLGIALRGVDLDVQVLNGTSSPAAHLLEVTEDPILSDPLKQVLKTGQPLLSVEYHQRDPLGGKEQKHWLLNYFPVKTTDGRILGVGTTAQDISEQKKAEQALKESQHFLLSIQDTTPAVMYLSDTTQGRIVYANRHLEETLGYTTDEVQTMTREELDAILHPEDLGSFVQHQETVALMEDDITLEREFRIRHKAGHWKWFYSRHRVFSRDDTGKPVLVLSGILDLTNQKEMKVLLELREQEMQQLHAAQQSLLEDTTHEMKSPLTSIQGNMELLERHPEMPTQERQEVVEEVKMEAIRLGKLVHGLLWPARAGHVVEDLSGSVALHAVAWSVWKSLKKQHPQLFFKLGHVDQVDMEGNLDHLRQLLIILIDNAAKYTLVGGRISLSMVRMETQVEIRIRDTGIGLKNDDLQRVFERFYRVDPSRNPQGDPGGSGLGLSIAKSIVAEHGGSLWLESEPGEGTEAVVHLPLGHR
ncbi:hypothetical protein GCM10008938_52060 [Deinococcus roseus]|uniref:histidine kinase n=2 Tax=Deinococcus roseus TaxID=392414 RepID=A0ABQ2DIU1_9DEIO|nr:hypothetical protein GCM10008938_52060 [Deinococcus roseus]